MVPNALPSTGLEPRSPGERRILRRRLGVDDDAFLVVSVGRLTPAKRPLDLVEVAARLRSACPGLRHVHLGNGPLEDDVRARAEALALGPAFHLAGFVPEPASVLAAADAFVLTSRIEGIPNAVLESQALGVPVVVTDAGATREALVPGETGILCPVGDVEAIAAGLGSLQADAGARAEMGGRGATWVREAFSGEAMIERTRALYAPGPALAGGATAGRPA